MSGITITADSGTQFENGAAEYNSICKLDSNNYAIAYRDNTNSNRGTVNVGSRVGTSVTINSANAQVFCTNSTQSVEIVSLSSTKVAIIFEDITTGKPYVVICTISGTTITVGTPVDFTASTYIGNNRAEKNMSISVLDSSNIVCYISPNSNFNCYAYVGSISGTTPTFGSAQLVNSSGGVQRLCSIGLDSTHSIVAYVLNGSPSTVSLRSGTVNTGAQTISFGTDTQIASPSAEVASLPVIRIFDSQHVIVGYNNNSGTDLALKCMEINLATNGITVGTAITNTTASSADSNYSLCCIGTNNFLISYYTTAGTQCEMRGGTFSGSTTLAFDAQGPVIVDNNPSSYTALCALTSTDFIIGLKEN